MVYEMLDWLPDERWESEEVYLFFLTHINEQHTLMSHQASSSSQDAGFEFQRRRKDKGKEKEKPTEEGEAMTAQDILRATGNAALSEEGVEESQAADPSDGEISDESDGRVLHNLDRVASIMAGAHPSVSQIRRTIER